MKTGFGEIKPYSVSVRGVYFFFLGYIIRTLQVSIFLNADKKSKAFGSIGLPWENRYWCPRRGIMSTLVLMMACIPAMQWVQLQMRLLKSYLLEHWDGMILSLGSLVHTTLMSSLPDELWRSAEFLGQGRFWVPSMQV